MYTNEKVGIRGVDECTGIVVSIKSKIIKK